MTAALSIKLDSQSLTYILPEPMKRKQSITHAATVDPDEMFPQMEKMIYQHAWKFSQQYPVTFEEAKTEAYWGFMRACHNFKPGNKSKFSTWCYMVVWATLKDMTMQRATDPLLTTEMTEELCGEAPSLSQTYMESLEDLIAGLSRDAKQMLELILHPPAEMLEGGKPTPFQLMKRVKRELVAQGKDSEWVEWVEEDLGATLQPALA